MSIENTFVMLKPGVLQRRIVGKIISRIEDKGLQIIALRLLQISPHIAQQHYAEHHGKPFFEDLISYVTSAPVIAMVLSGECAISRVRLLAGATKIEEAQPGTIRGDFANATTKNIIHASDSAASAEREISLFFHSPELISYQDTNTEWIV